MRGSQTYAWFANYKIVTGSMGVGRRAVGGLGPPWILKISAKKYCFLSFEYEKQISPLLTPLQKFCKNSLVTSPWKKPSDAHNWC